MFEGVFIYVHVVLGFSVFVMFKHMHKDKHHYMHMSKEGRNFTQLLNKKVERTRRSSLLLLSVCSVAYAFSLLLLCCQFVFGALTLTRIETPLYIFLIFTLLHSFKI
jgi:hypothetical protein